MNALTLKALALAKEFNQTQYIFCTSARWFIQPSAPSFERQHIRCEPCGTATYRTFNHVTEAWEETIIGKGA